MIFGLTVSFLFFSLAAKFAFFQDEKKYDELVFGQYYVELQEVLMSKGNLARTHMGVLTNTVSSTKYSNVREECTPLIPVSSNYTSFQTTLYEHNKCSLDSDNFGRVPPYNFLEQDLSGAAAFKVKDNEYRILTVDDGGKSSKYSFMHVYDNPFCKFERHPVDLRDLEAATQLNEYLVITSSLADNNSKGWTSRYSITQFPNRQEKVKLRNRILSIIKDHSEKYSKQKWYRNISDLPVDKGGLNIEGLSFIPKSKEGLVFGLRAPLWEEKTIQGKEITINKAMLVFINQPFSDNQQLRNDKVVTIDLDGKGIRGLEYVDYLKGYIIIAGPSIGKSGNFQLWFYDDYNGALVNLSKEIFNRFSELCRPESVIVWKKIKLLIIGEESNICKGKKTTFIQIPIKKVKSYIEKSLIYQPKK